MNIIFQFGDFYGEGADFLSNLLPEVLGSLIGAGAAILLYYWQTNKEKQKEFTDKKDKIQNKILYLGTLVKSSTSTIEQQNDYLKKFIDEFKKDLANIPLLKYSIDGDINRLLKVFNEAEYYHAFIEYYSEDKDKISIVQKYRKITSTIDWSYYTMLDIKVVLMNIVSFHRERCLKYKRNFDKILIELREIIEETRHSNINLNNILSNILNNYLDSLSNEKEASISYYHTLISKIMDCFNKENSGGNNAIFVSNIIEILSLYDEIINQNNRHIVGTFEPLIEQFEQVITDLKQNSEQLIKPFSVNKK